MTVRSVSKAVAIMRYLAQSDAPQGVNDIARAVAMAPSSAFNILKTLVEESLIRFSDTSKRYTIDADALPLFTPKQDLTLWFNDLHRQLGVVADTHLLSCGLWDVFQNRAVLREVFDSPDSTRVYLSRGLRLPSHIGAMGRCVAAHEGLARVDVGRVVGELRWQSPPSVEGFWQDVIQVRALGWAVDRSNYIRGLTTLAAAICDEGGRVIFCLTGTGFDGQHDNAQLNMIGAQLAEIAARAGTERIRLLGG